MLERLRTPFLVAALIMIGIVVAVELGATAILSTLGTTAETGQEAVAGALEQTGQILPERIRNKVEEQLAEAEEEDDDDVDSALLDLADTSSPGLAIRYLALVDGILFLTIGLIAAGVLVPEYIQGKVQGVATLVAGLLLLLAAVGLIVAAIAKLILMVSLLLAAPFGTLAYLAVYASFPRGLAAGILGLLLTLKVASGISLVAAHQRFLQNKGLVLLVLSALLANIVVTFLHAFVPGLLVSITDAIGAIVVAICGAIWAIFLIVGGVIATIKTLT